MEEVEKPRKSSCLKYCLIIFLVLFFLISLTVASLLAKSGLVQIPILSHLFYKEPKEIVKPDLEVKQHLSQKLKEIQIQAQKKQSKEVEIQLTQEEVLGLITLLLQKSTTPFKNPQILIHPDRVETWTKIDISESKKKIPLGFVLKDEIWLLVDFLPITMGKKVQFEIKKVQLGSLTIPSSLINQTLNTFLARYEKNPTYDIQGISSLRLEEGKIIIKTSPELFPQFESQFR